MFKYIFPILVLTLTLLLTIMLTGCDEETPTQLSIDTTQITLSGLSSGAYMANQYHLAHADNISGVGLIAGGPFYCAQGNIANALASCVDKQSVPIATRDIDQQIDQYQAQGLLASDEAIASSKVWIFHGANDTKIIRPVAQALITQYQQWITAADALQTELDIAASHHFPTLAQGHACDSSQSPYIGNCGYDAAGKMLTFLLPQIKSPATELSGSIIEINQHELGGEPAQTIAETGYAYVPKSCQTGEVCSLHISFHGCNQYAGAVGTEYAEHTGLNRWADTNNMVVLYPQTKQSMFMPMNPQGCWDWWGYTDALYATKQGQQIQAINNIVNALHNTL